MFAFAFKTLLSNRGKFLTALIGVVFSLVLISIQGGLFLGLMEKASLLVDNSNADNWDGHQHVELVDLPKRIPEIWLNRVRGLPGVKDAEPCVVGNGFISLPDGRYENVWVIGSDPASSLGGGWAFVEGSRHDLLRPEGISVDRLDAARLGHPAMNDVLGLLDEAHRHRPQLRSRHAAGRARPPDDDRPEPVRLGTRSPARLRHAQSHRSGKQPVPRHRDPAGAVRRNRRLRHRDCVGSHDSAVISSQLAPIRIPLQLLCGGLAQVFGICMLATVLPVRRIQRLDPAIVLQG